MMISWKIAQESLKKCSISNYIAIGALAISIATFVKSCIQDSDIKDSQYQQGIHLAKPCLKLVGEPKIIGFGVESGEFNLDSMLTGARLDSAGIPTTEMNMKITVRSRVRVTNTGNALAKAFAYVQADSVTMRSLLRSMVLDLKNYGDQVKLTALERVKELLPHDTTDFDLESRIIFADSSKFIVHDLILYENDLGMLFDTYVWATYPITRTAFLFHLNYASGRPVIDSVFLESRDLRGVLPKALDVNVSYETYTRDQAARIKASFEHLYDAQTERLN